MKIKYIILAGFAIFVFVASEILLLKQNSKLKQSKQQLESQLFELKNEHSKQAAEDNLSGANLPLFTKIKDHFLGYAKPLPNFLLVFYFTTLDCGSCVSQEIQVLNEFYQTIDNTQCGILTLIDKQNEVILTQIARRMNIRFPTISIDSLSVRLDQIGIKRTPLLCYGDARFGKILYAFFPTPLHQSKTAFLGKVRGFLDQEIAYNN